MAFLSDARGSLRFDLSLAAFESPPLRSRIEREAELAKAESPRIGLPIVGEAPPPRRLLATASMDFYDRKDQEFWPFVRMGVLWLGPGDARDLSDGLGRLIRDEVPGFAFRSECASVPGGASELALQIGRVGESGAEEDGSAGRRAEAGGPEPSKTVYAIEIGLDLAALLNEASGAKNEPGEALSLFRFSTGRPQLVAFGQELQAELAAVEQAGGLA